MNNKGILLKILFGALFSTGLLLASNCSPPLVDDVTHQQARIIWNAGFALNASSPPAQRIQYGTTTKYGYVQSPYAIQGFPAGGLQGFTISALAASTIIHVAPQSWDGAAWCNANQMIVTLTSGNKLSTSIKDANGTLLGSLPSPFTLGKGWSITGPGIPPGTTIADFSVTQSSVTLSQPATSTGTITATVDSQFTTLDLPNPHPAHPAPAVDFDTSTPPVQTGKTWTVGGNCRDFQTCLNSAVYGDTVVIPAGTKVDPGPGVAFASFGLPDAFDGILIRSIDTKTGIWSTAAPNKLTDGQAVQVTGKWGSPTPFSLPETYYVVNSSPTGFQLSATRGGPPIIAKDYAGAGNKTMVMPIPVDPKHKWIVIRTSTPDAQLPPAGVRLDPKAYGSKLATITCSHPMTAGTANGYCLNLQGGVFSHHYWFIGIEFTHEPTATLDTVDPPPYRGLVSTNASNLYITFDRCWFRGLPPPDRDIAGLFLFEGQYMAVVNSALTGFAYWRPHLSGTTVTLSSRTSLNISAGTYKISPATACKVPAAKVDIGNGNNWTGNAILYMDLSCNLNLVAGPGITASGVTVANSANPTLPTNKAGLVSGARVATVAFSNGAMTAAYDVKPWDLSQFNTEGSAAIDTERGPGPTKVENNLIEAIGISIFFGDSVAMHGTCTQYLTGCPQTVNLHDEIIRRNLLFADLKYKAESPANDGLRYTFRNGPEWKTGNRILMEGNRLVNTWADVNKASAVLLNSNSSNTPPGLATINEISDFEFRYNTITGAASSIFISQHQPGVGSPSKAMKRAWIHDNLLTSNGGYLNQTAQAPVGGTGEQFTSTVGPPEDTIIEHNTVFDNRGPYGAVHQMITKIADGYTVRNNIFVYNADNNFGGIFWNPPQGGPNVPDYTGLRGTALFAAMPLSSWTHNLLVPWWQVSVPPGSEVEMKKEDIRTLADTYSRPPGTWVPDGPDLRSRLASIGWVDATIGGANNNFKLRPDSPYAHKGSDGRDIGADIDALEAAQGKVSNVLASLVTGNSATLGFLAPDSFPCTVDWGTSDFASGNGTFTRVDNPGGQRQQTVPLTRLPAGSQIWYRVNCAVMQPTGTFKTN